MPDHELLGPWSEDNFTSTVRTAIAGVGADTDLPREIRFLGSVAKLVRLRLAQSNSSGDPQVPAVFLLKAAPEDPNRSYKREPMLNTGLTPVTGRLWFVSEVVNSGRYVDLDEKMDNDTLFSLVTQDLNLGNVPALIFDPRPAAKQLRFYPSGLSKDDICEICELKATNISANRLFTTIDKVWNASLKTPQQAAGAFTLWENARRGHPTRYAERVIQGLLRLGVQVDFPTCTPRLEYVLDTGRCDILLEENDTLEPSKTTCHAILELKVLRAFSHKGDSVSTVFTAKAIVDGIDQVSAYSKEKHAAIAALCCFDMREACSRGSCFDPVRSDAANVGVALAIWFLFSSSKQYRDFQKAAGSDFRDHY